MPPSIGAREELVIWISRIAMKQPTMPPAMASQSRSPAFLVWIFTVLAGAAVQSRTRARRRRAGIDPRLRRQAGADFDALQAVAVEQDLHRHALDDLGEVAGGVLRRQQRELRTGAGRQAVDRAGEVEVGIHVERDPDMLAT